MWERTLLNDAGRRWPIADPVTLFSQRYWFHAFDNDGSDCIWREYDLSLKIKDGQLLYRCSRDSWPTELYSVGTGIWLANDAAAYYAAANNCAVQPADISSPQTTALDLYPITHNKYNSLRVGWVLKTLRALRTGQARCKILKLVGRLESLLTPYDVELGHDRQAYNT